MLGKKKFPSQTFWLLGGIYYMAHCAWMHDTSLQPCLTLCNPMDWSLSGFSVHGILQARILEWVACPLPGDLLHLGIEPTSPVSNALAGRFFITSATSRQGQRCMPFKSLLFLIRNQQLFPEALSRRFLLISQTPKPLSVLDAHPLTTVSYQLLMFTDHACMLSHYSQVWLFVTLWTVAHQAPLSLGFSRQEYWSGLPCPPSKGSSQPRDWTCISYVSCTGKQVLYH